MRTKEGIIAIDGTAVISAFMITVLQFAYVALAGLFS